MRQKRRPTLTRVCRGLLPGPAHWVATTGKWGLQTIRFWRCPRLPGPPLEADVGLAQGLTEGCQSGGAQLSSAGEVLQQVPGDRTVPELVEAGGEAGHGGLQVFADLAVEGGAFADQVAALADEQLQRGPSGVAGRFEQGAAGDSGAVNRCQVGVLGLVAGI